MFYTWSRTSLTSPCRRNYGAEHGAEHLSQHHAEENIWQKLLCCVRHVNHNQEEPTLSFSSATSGNFKHTFLYLLSCMLPQINKGISKTLTVKWEIFTVEAKLQAFWNNLSEVGSQALSCVEDIYYVCKHNTISPIGGGGGDCMFWEKPQISVPWRKKNQT